MSYFDNFLTANQAYVALHGDLRLPIKFIDQYMQTPNEKLPVI